MDIVNKSDTDASWFCYNSYNSAKWVALGSGDLSANGGSFSYQPPKNDSGLCTLCGSPKKAAGPSLQAASPSSRAKP